MSSRRLTLCVSLMGVPMLTHAQSSARGVIVAAEDGSPIVGVSVWGLRSRAMTTSDRFGRFALVLRVLPETLVFAFIGRAADSLPVEGPIDTLHVTLQPAPLSLATLLVPASPSLHDQTADAAGAWQVPIGVSRTVPAAVETDPLRTLSLAPAVSFTTPLSARPLLRGYDADLSSIRLDGFEVINPYHIGRVFGVFPADAVGQVVVRPGPPAASDGGSLSGVIDVLGREGDPQATHGGGDLSLASATAWMGGGSDRWRAFGAARAASLSAVAAIGADQVPYDFQDLYIGLAAAPFGRRLNRLTVFASRDHLGDRSSGQGMDWRNALVGNRSQVLASGPTTLDVTSSVSTFSEDGTNIPAHHADIDVRNRLSRASLGFDWQLQAGRAILSVGATLGFRHVANRIAPRSGDFPSADLDRDRIESSAYTDLARQVGSATVAIGARLDVAGSVPLVQPRARVNIPLVPELALRLAAGRAGRLYHLVSDPRAEPSLAFYDFWFPAGEAGYPTPILDLGSADLEFRRGATSARLAAFLSRANGLVELRPETDQETSSRNPFRTGRGRSLGFELQLARSDITVSYTLTVSERSWSGSHEWVPWSQDRRHIVRLFGTRALGARWMVFGKVEGASGAPVTPVAQLVFRPLPDSSGSVASGVGIPVYVYGREGSARSSGTLELDAGARYRFRGPGRSQVELGLSVLNVGFGPVAPLVPVDPIVAVNDGRITYKRLYDLPAVPTVTLRIEF